MDRTVAMNPQGDDAGDVCDTYNWEEPKEEQDESKRETTRISGRASRLVGTPFVLSYTQWLLNKHTNKTNGIVLMRRPRTQVSWSRCDDLRNDLF